MQEKPQRETALGLFYLDSTESWPLKCYCCQYVLQLSPYLLSKIWLVALSAICFTRESKVRGADAGNGIRVFIPDIGMFVLGLAICCHLVQKRAHEDTAQYNADFQLEEMAWSIKYVSWLTFVFLIWSCLLCLECNLRCYAMLSSPFLMACDSVLIVLLYIWTFQDMGCIRVKGFFVKKKIRSSHFHLGFRS